MDALIIAGIGKPKVFSRFSEIFLSRFSISSETESNITFPEFSIGKLAAAKVDDLRIWSPSGKKNICDFKITGLSSNMNINPGDRVYLLPDNERDISSITKLEQWKIIIKEMVWDPKINGYYIFSQDTNSKRLDEYKGLEDNFSWFIYHTSLDVWSNKLYKRNGLLKKF